MTLQQHALLKLAEEASELAQRALKMAQFGGTETQPGQTLDNAERLLLEFMDLNSSMIRCQRLGLLRKLSHLEAAAHHIQKEAKVEKYLRLSQKLAMVECGPCNERENARERAEVKTNV